MTKHTKINTLATDNNVENYNYNHKIDKIIIKIIIMGMMKCKTNIQS